MKTNEIYIRDPYVLVYEGKYYMYGTRGTKSWDKSTDGAGFDVFVSEDLESWSDAIEVFAPPAGFWGKYNFWAPEVHYYNGAFYMLASFKSDDACRGTQILRADRPDGAFTVWSEVITPRDWECLDGTLYVEDGVPYMVFCHEWLQVGDGEMCAVKLKPDLSGADGEPMLLFKASEAPWVKSVRNDEEVPWQTGGVQNGNYVTDGPFLIKTTDGGLVMIWSSFGEYGYVEAVARSESGKIAGKWLHDTDKPLFDRDGGHGMLFDTTNGRRMLVLHSPNGPVGAERPRFTELEERGGKLFVKEK